MVYGMNKREKEILQAQLNNEKAVLKQLEEMYKEALLEINSKIELLMARQDADLQHVIYQAEYQKALKTQVQAILEALQANEFETISEYLANAYEEGFIGTMYNLQGQGIPLIFPIDQKQVLDAIQTESNLSTTLYEAMGKDVKDLQKKIAGEISRGISGGKMYTEIARNIAGYARIPKNNAMRIVRTEAHRIQTKATMDACNKAQSKGADVVKQWDASLDKRTRRSHRRLDGEIRELDEPFSNGLQYPGDPDGDASEVINCRCALLQRARWAVGNDFTKWGEDAPVMIDDDGTTQFHNIEAKNYDDFKKQYLKASERVRSNAQKMNNDETTYHGGIPKKWKTMDTSKDDAVKNANPNYKQLDGAYKKNCPNCACAYELRKRGYDVVAKPYVKGGSHHLNKKPWEAWKDASVKTVKSNKDILEYINQHEDGARYGIAIKYSDGTAHVLVAEKSGGKIRIYDAQSGKNVKGIDFDDASDVKLWQTNNLELSDRGTTSCEGR